MRLLLTAFVLTAALLAPAGADAARVPLPPQLVVHTDTPCPYDDEGGSCSYGDSPDVYLAPGTGPVVRFHEIGHQFDRQALTDTDRAWFMRLFHQGDWDNADGAGETFANAYAACAVEPFRLVRRHGIRVYKSTLEFGYMPTVRQHHRACNAIAVLGLVRLAQR